jgi:DNA-binding NarL/FixJ family response regulator
MRVLIADEHTLVRRGMRLLLQTISGVNVIGEAADWPEILRRIEELRPDILLTDVGVPGMDGLQTIRNIAGQYPDTRILILFGVPEALIVHQALIAGAAGCLLKRASETELARALTTVSSGRTYICPAISHAIVAVLARAAGARPGLPAAGVLTLRQREILILIADGLTTKQMAARLGLSAKTVEAHRTAIMDRLGIRDLAGLVRFALRTGLVERDP